MQDRLNDIISGIGGNVAANPVQTTLHHLRTSKAAGRTAEKPERFNKEDENSI